MKEQEIETQLEYIKRIRELNNKKTINYNILTMGYQLKENDSEKISGMLSNMGYIKTNNLEKSDIFVINTCCVRENAEEKLFRKTWGIKKNKGNK